MDATLNYYNQNAESFVAGTLSADMSAQYKFFLKYVPLKAKILDLGCGSGRDSAHFASLGFDVVAVDGSAELCKRAKEIYGIDAVCALFEDISFDKEFDAVWACASLLHVDKAGMPDVLRKLSGALKPSGILYASFKYGNTERISGGRFFNDYTEGDIGTLLTPENQLILQEYWITEDVRPERSGEQWLNFIAMKK